MDRKVQSGSCNSGKLVYWSSLFLRQPARVLIVDAQPPWWSSTCMVLCDALDNFLSLACSLDGPCRIPLLCLYAVSRQQECLLPFVQVRGNLARLRSCVEELRSIPGEGCATGLARGCEMLRQAALNSLQQFKQYIRHVSAGGQARNSISVEVTLVTSKPGRSVVHLLESGLKDADLLSLKRLLVVQISRDTDSGPDSPPPEATYPENSDGAVFGTEVDLQQVDNSVYAMEMVFKAWLQEQGGDKEHIHLLLPSPSDNPVPVCIKCDMQERLISPALIPVTPNLGVKTESVHDFMPVKGSGNQSQAPQSLRVIKALRADGLCESVLYGLPLVIRPTTCWQLDWDEMEANVNMFHALCHTLRSCDTFLLLQVEPAVRSTAGGSGLYSHYILQPSPSLTLLLKPVVSRELFLPCSLPLPTEDPPADALQLIQGCVSQLDEECVFNPLSLTSSLYQHLRSRGLLSEPRYPYRLQPATNRLRPQPPESAKATVSRQPRQQQSQSRQQGSNSRVRATVAPMPLSSPSSSSLEPPSAKASRPALTFLSGRGPHGSHRASAAAQQEEEGDDDDSTPMV